MTAQLNFLSLHSDLIALCDGTRSEAFFYRDIQKDFTWYRVFAYHLASYTDFTHPSALEARGVLFQLDDNKAPVALVCLPPQKFFNLFENPFTIGLDPNSLVGLMTKEDGSLISTFIHEGKMALKSKTSLFSEQVAMAQNYLTSTMTGNRLRVKLETLTMQGLTVNCELVSPMNRIVLPYSKTSLVILNVRDLKTGVTYFPGDSKVLDELIGIDWVETLPAPAENPQEYLESIEKMEGIEGFVLKFRKPEGGILLAKLKTKWYQLLHHTKDSVTIPRRLFECIIDEVVDDLKAMFHNDPLALKTIAEMEEKVVPKFDHMVHQVEDFWQTNKELSRKDYAIKGQKELGPLFSLGMMMYLGKEVNFKEFAKKNIDMFDVKPTVETGEME